MTAQHPNNEAVRLAGDWFVLREKYYWLVAGLF
jgi:hypothetical protein